MIKISIDSKALQASLKKLTTDLNKEASESIQSMAAMGGKELAHRVQPFGLTGKAQSTLEGAVYKDISRAYDYVGEAYNKIARVDKKKAIAYIKAINNNDLAAAEKYSRGIINGIGTSDSGNNLSKARTGPKRRVQDNFNPMVVTDDQTIQNLKQKNVVSAGLVKAGFLQASKYLGRKATIPEWLRKSKLIGTGLIIKNGWETVVTVINNVRYASSAISESNIQKAINQAYKNQIKKLQRQVDALLKKV